MDKKYIFETKIMVRDYECDIEGIVNNANYMHYAEHTRISSSTPAGISFAELHRQGQMPSWQGEHAVYPRWAATTNSTPA